MGKKSGPPPPDYTKLAEQTANSQNDQLLQQTWANRPSQVDAFGNSMTWQATPAKDASGNAILDSSGKPIENWTQTQTLNPQQRQIYESQQQMQQGRTDIANSLMGNVATQMANGPVDFSQFQGLADPWSASNLRATTGATGGQPQLQNINTSLQSTPQLRTALDYNNLQGVQGSDASRQTAYDQLMNQATSRLDPQWQKQQTQLETQLANQGITRGSAAFDQAMQQFGQTKTDAYNQAMMSAQQGATAQAQANQGMDMSLRQQQAAEAGNQANFYNTAAGQMFGFGNQANASQLAAQQAAYQQALSGAQYGLQQQNQAFNQQAQAGQQNFGQAQSLAGYQNQLRQQQIAEAQQQQNWSLNALNALLSGQQVSNPNFANFSQAQQGVGVDYSGAGDKQFQAGMQQQQMQNQATGQLLQGASGMAGMFMMSDRRTKTDIRRIGTHRRGIGIYRYRFIGESRPRVGVMADEVARVLPHAVKRWHGIAHVDYAAL